MPETIRWTVLPDGQAADGTLRLTVLVSPRLTGGTRLDAFDGFRDWPDTLRRYAPALQIEFLAPGATGPGVLLPTTARSGRFPPADSGLWGELFKGDTVVRPPAGAFAAAAERPPTLRSYPAGAVRDQVTALYEAAVSATAARRAEPPSGGSAGNGAALTAGQTQGPAASWDHPQSHDLRGVLTSAIRTFAGRVGAGYPRLDELLARSAGGRFGAAADPNPYRPRHMNRAAREYAEDGALLGLAEMYRFYDRAPRTSASGAGTGQAAAEAEPPPAKPDFDFHIACALLADYPEILRRFGLALDLVVTPPAGLADGWQARVTFTAAQGQLNTDESLRPWTALRHVPGRRFEPYAADDGFHGHRMLKLGADTVHVTDLDLDGAAMKFVEFSRVLDQYLSGTNAPGTAAAADPTALPALHGAGLTVVHDDRDRALADQMEADARHTAGVGPDSKPVAAAVLDAAHLVRGLRVDVGPADERTGRVTVWYPLCARTGEYAIRRPGAPAVPIGAAPDEGHVKASAVTRDRADDQQLYVHQALFGWHGWSLAAPPPGRTLGPGDRPQVPNPEISDRFPLAAAFRPTPGTLPALRYGRTYRLRARLVDLAGNSLGPEAPSVEGTATEPVTYGRWEPVPPPVIVPRWPFLEGESEPRLVIRSTIDASGRPLSPGEWAALRNGQVPDHEQVSPADGLDRRYRAFDERHLSPPKSSLQMAEQHGVYDAVFGPGKPDALRRQYFAAASRESGSYLDTVVSLPEDPRVTRDLKAAGEIHVAKHSPHDTSPLTELPVPRGSGLHTGEYVVHDAPQLLLPYLPDVPARGIALRGLPGTGTGTDAGPHRTYDFTGTWPQARPLRLRIVEGDRPPDPPTGGVLTVYVPKAEVVTVRLSCRIAEQDLRLFRVWQLLTASPLWNDPLGLTPEKRRELTVASAAGENWMITPWTELTLVHAVEKPLAPPSLADLRFSRTAGETSAFVEGVLSLHARSTGRIDLDATWQEWLDDVKEPAPRRVTGYDHVGDLTPGPRSDTFTFSGVRHEFRDTRHRNVTYTPTATTRFREYFHPAITDRPELITSRGPAASGPAGQGWPVPATRRPEPPEVSHIVPTFTWEQTVDTDAHRVTRTRRAAGIRVYLRRPWFSSGDDELLAVVLDPGSRLPAELVTRCGIDPVWADDSVLPRLRPANFPNAAGTATGRTLAETVGGAPATVSVATFAPVYDTQLGLWSCDIDVNLGDLADSPAYYPFLRPALARYQPYAVEPLHLSKVVTGEYVQLMPERTVTAAMTADGRIHIELSGPAAANDVGEFAGPGREGAAASRRVVATVQQRPRTAGDLEWTPADATAELTCTPRGTGFIWTGDLTPPPGRFPSPTRHRLLIEESETYFTDRTTATATVTAGGVTRPVSRRLVHADFFGLTTTVFGKVVLEE
ncbi:hypothetical protein DMH15_19395 [Streptomyces sp. WAC 06725]|uniref:hypothetical protein n=1 Tax=Streptomyces sp. WAC 06725 TaxID=2203209 RepID=UPI000F738BE4|nr:hypothetical protein [Streptomyces sp. WAC 06725]RSO36002.1 hypothetical protein DMH15_19395 [Streptomyces sp. WAC 06725]